MKTRICQILGALMLGALGHYAFQALMSSKQEHVAPAVVSQKIEKSSDGEEKYITIIANATAGFKPRSEVSQSNNNNQTSVTPSSSK